MEKVAKLEWHTEKRRVSELILFDGNPRQMSEKQADDLLKSLKKFNLVEIPVIDTTNRVLAGNMRVTSLHVLNRENEEIEVRVPNRKLTEKEAQEYLLRSNKNTGSWDMDLLADFGEDMLVDCGWDVGEIFSEKEELDEKEVPLVCIKKIHILLSLPLDSFSSIQQYLAKILEVKGVEYEQACN
ncbi:MAG: hypothetical protein QME49_04810 [bacterium]|nr:hypothetical protein [bacterium]